jgi:tRNA pseudouridine55 synthase
VTVASGLVLVDKPAGMTSHDVVARVRRTVGTRKVGHAGTLDPMATGVLVLGVERATRLLGHLMLTEKTYSATVRLGAATTTDDAEGEITVTTSAAHLADAARAAFPSYDLDAEQTQAVRYGRALPLQIDELTAVFAPDGEFLALYRPEGDRARPAAVFVG